MLEEWRDFAACLALPEDEKDWFFSEDDNHILQAQAICAGCIAVEECLSYALHTGQVHGVFGMHSQQDRRTLKRFLTLRPAEAQKFWERSFEKILARIDQMMQLSMDLEIPESPIDTGVSAGDILPLEKASEVG